MKNESNAKTGFTLVEMMVSMALASLAVVMVLTLLVFNAGSWRETIARLTLSESSRLVREKVLHGINGNFGLRHASRSQMLIEEDSITFKDISSQDEFTLLWLLNSPPLCVSAAGVTPLAKNGVFLDSVDISGSEKTLVIDFTLAVTNAGRKYTQPQRIQVYLLNE
ncbi:MAG: prepilin-type N-terminal cleavage/methylation domain-containing protein [Lentisphaerae bacterium]|nr:prepilin-type N-terminal cleavage/methylation domain-containing protein [Lentisphaerota bacterium]